MLLYFEKNHVPKAEQEFILKLLFFWIEAKNIKQFDFKLIETRIRDFKELLFRVIQI